MREERAVIGTKGLITLPKEWRDSHNLQVNDEATVKVIYKMGGVLIVIPASKELSRMEALMVTFLEKGLSAEELKDQVGLLTEAKVMLEQMVSTAC